jgi:hypothetical protein
MGPSELPPPVQIMALTTAMFPARCVHAVAEAGVADHVTDTPQQIETIALAAGLRADPLRRVLRLLEAHGIFAEEVGGWRHTAASATLRSDHPHSTRAFAQMIGNPFNWDATGRMLETLKSGRVAGESIHPGGSWAWYRENPEQARVFDAAMVSKAQGEIGLLQMMHDFSTSQRVVDVAGGAGHFLHAILNAHPHLSGVLFDLPDVVAAAPDHDRATKAAGDFFKDALPAGDTYLLSNILHDWEDAEAVAILECVRRSAPSGAQVLVLEQWLPTGPEHHPSKNLDIVMLLIVGGRERTDSAYADLFSQAGLIPAGTRRCPGPVALQTARVP